jgi:hypothetical protein
MSEQNYSNHRRYVPAYHIVLTLLLTAGLITSIINVIRHPANNGGHVSSVLIALLFICAIFLFWYCRQFPLKAQDRAIRAEEGLRFFILSGKTLDRRLTIGQIAALRFADDEEFVKLTAKALAENLSPDEIKKLIKRWRTDHHRV